MNVIYSPCGTLLFCSSFSTLHYIEDNHFVCKLYRTLFQYSACKFQKETVFKGDNKQRFISAVNRPVWVNSAGVRMANRWKPPFVSAQIDSLHSTSLELDYFSLWYSNAHSSYFPQTLQCEMSFSGLFLRIINYESFTSVSYPSFSPRVWPRLHCVVLRFCFISNLFQLYLTCVQQLY